MATPDTRWHVYLVRCRDDALYAGIATDVARRFEEHVDGRGAKFLRGRGPLKLVRQAEVGERGLALRVEHRIKRLPKTEKERIAGRRGAAQIAALIESVRESV